LLYQLSYLGAGDGRAYRGCPRRLSSRIAGTAAALRQSKRGGEMTERLVPLISERRIRARTAQLAHQIDADYRGRPLSLVVVLKGAVVFAADLMRQITIPVTLDFIAASSYGNATRSSGKVALRGLDRLDIAGRPVLIVEDILDSGRTAAAIVAALQQRQPASLAFCALLRKPGADASELPVAYAGFRIPDDFVVGWGMDYAERYRNLRGVHRLILD
jgi:hypoxanthine phosphoribosyltransferase